MQIARTNPEWPFHRWKPNNIKYNLYFKSVTWSYLVRMNDYKTFWTLKNVYTITNFLYLFYIPVYIDDYDDVSNVDKIRYYKFNLITKYSVLGY